MPINRFLLSLIGLFLAYLVCFLWLDRPIALWAHAHLINTPLYQTSTALSHIFEPDHWVLFALFLLLFSVSLALLQKKTQAKSWCFISLSIIAALAIGLIFKVLLGRYRPVMLFSEHQYGFHFLTSKHNFTSTPSGHTLASFAGFYALAMVMKKRWITVLLMLLGALIGISRVIITDHYLSDVIFGAYLGILTPIYLQLFWNKLLGVTIP